MGRSQNDFVEGSDRLTRWKTLELRSSRRTMTLTYETKINLRLEGKFQAAKIVADTVKSPNSVNSATGLQKIKFFLYLLMLDLLNSNIILL